MFGAIMNKAASMAMFAIILFFGGCSRCNLETELTHQAAVPLVESLTQYAQKNGIPQTFEQTGELPYPLKPCTQKPDLIECEVFKEGYYFQLDGQYFSVRLLKYPTVEEPKGFGLYVVHNYTSCSYEIYNDAKVLPTPLKPSCSLIGRCRDWGRQ